MANGFNPHLNNVYASSLIGSTTALSDVVRNITVTFIADEDLGFATLHTCFEDPKGQDMMEVYPGPLVMVAETWVKEAEAEELWWLKYEAQCAATVVEDDDLIEIESNTLWEEFH